MKNGLPGVRSEEIKNNNKKCDRVNQIGFRCLVFSDSGSHQRDKIQSLDSRRVFLNVQSHICSQLDCIRGFTSSFYWTAKVGTVRDCKREPT